MKKILLLLSLVWMGANPLLAQLPDGTVAPNFTVTNVVNNQSHTLYTLLDQGKTVYLDFFATWCAPCWNYHQSHALANLWDQYGPPGTNEAFVIAIESDATTNIPCIFGPSGCVGGTQGNWTDGTPYPIADAASVANQYQIGYYPTIMMVCPADRKVYEVGQQSTAGLWASRDAICPPLEVNIEIAQVKNVSCYGTNTGKIDISIAFGGTPPYTYNWSNGAATQDLTNIPAGNYSCTVTSSQGWTGTTGVITVEAPAEPLSMQVVGSTPMGCNGVRATRTVEGLGGWPDYSYAWSNGQSGAEATGLLAGNYNVTVADNNGCTKSFSLNVPPAEMPTATIDPPGIITCSAPTQQLNVVPQGGTGDYLYQWNASAGGNIVSGGETANPVINAAGNYGVHVTDAYTTCNVYTTSVVSANITPPAANAGPDKSVTCSAPSTVLEGSGSTGNNIAYSWTASNGGNIVSGGNTLSPTVNASGTYTLLVTNSVNGCTQSSAAAVTGNNTPPSADVAGGAFTCLVDTIVLTASTNAASPSFAWSGPNGFTSNEQNPAVTVTGTYLLTISDAATGCTNTTAAAAVADTTAPGAAAAGGLLTCVATQVTLNGTSPDTTTVFNWTGPNGFSSNIPNPAVATPGEYNLVVTDTLNGCTSAAMATVGQNTTPPSASAATPGNLNCQDLQIQLDGSGSSEGANMTYAWSTTNGNIVSGDSTLHPLVDATGAYSLLVTNTNNGCTATAATQVAQSPPVTATVDNSTNVACHGGADGAATATPGGGNGAFSYLWSNGNTAATATGLAAGAYQVTVTDSENCTASAAITITEPGALVVNASATSQTAANTDDGTASANPSGGVSGYTYAWSNGENTQTITGLAPGDYTVTITDANGCTESQSVTVNPFNCTLSAELSSTNVNCFGANDGTATVSIQNGNEPATFVWSNGATTPSVENLAPGAYSVEITDITNCVVQFNLMITEPSAVETTASASAETGSGASDGTATANPSGGTPNYTFAWSNGETSQTITNLAPGAYTVTVTDANGCTSVESVVVNAFNCLLAMETTVTNVTCFGENNGSATLSPTGGAEPLTYLWSTGANTASIESLAPGAYTATVTDANGCQIVSDAIITEPEALETEASSTNPACPDDATGTASITAGGGTTPYAFNWSNGENTSSIGSLLPGTYTVTLTDANNCMLVNTFNLIDTDTEAPAITAQNTTLPLGASGTVSVGLQNLGASVTDNCAVSSVLIEPASFNCEDIGEQDVTITATDDAGNATSTTITVVVIDDIAPTITCPEAITQCWYNNVVEYGAPVAVDNCLNANGGWKQEEGLPSGSAFPTGVTNQVFSYTDASGNTGKCSFPVTITEPMNLTVVGVVNDVENQGLGSIDISVSGGSMPYKFSWTNKNGDLIGETEDLTGIPEGVYTVQVFDANGCQIAHESIVVGNTTGTGEPAWLEGLSIQPNPTSAWVRIILAQPLNTQLEVSLIDATGRLVLNRLVDHPTAINLDCSNLPSGIYQLRFRTGDETGARKLAVTR